MATLLNASNDDFIRTTEERHYAASQAIWKAMAEKGDIYKGSYAGWYSVRDEAYYGEEETEVRPDNIRYGPQGTPVEWVEEESYFFRLSAYQDKLLALYESQPDFIGPDERRNEVMSFVRSGLKDLSISRTTFDWGVPVPGDEKHVMYVWVDALTNYITAAGYPDTSAENWKFWPANVHIIGKDIVRFHAVYWPAFLMSAGHRTAEARLRPWLPVQPRREDVEVARQRRRPVRRWSSITASTRCATSSCARCRSARTAATAMRRSSTAPMPISPTTSAIWRSARCR